MMYDGDYVDTFPNGQGGATTDEELRQHIKDFFIGNTEYNKGVFDERNPTVREITYTASVEPRQLTPVVDLLAEVLHLLHSLTGVLEENIDLETFDQLEPCGECHNSEINRVYCHDIRGHRYHSESHIRRDHVLKWARCRAKKFDGGRYYGLLELRRERHVSLPLTAVVMGKFPCRFIPDHLLSEDDKNFLPLDLEDQNRLDQID